MEISGVSNGSTVAADSVLSCSAEGRPPPTYQWTAVTGVVKVTGSSSVTVQRVDTYYVLTCTASNTVTRADGTTENCFTSSTVYFNSEFSTELFFYWLLLHVMAVQHTNYNVTSVLTEAAANPTHSINFSRYPFLTMLPSAIHYYDCYEAKWRQVCLLSSTAISVVKCFQVKVFRSRFGSNFYKVTVG